MIYNTEEQYYRGMAVNYDSKSFKALALNYFLLKATFFEFEEYSEEILRSFKNLSLSPLFLFVLKQFYSFILFSRDTAAMTIS
jgi:hypothetical protein